ncbi:MAG: protease modulator HflK [Deltaproteobacteria bacterium]|nr:protease modulator HflK [Deltaproteobacteria bacterium]
MASDREQTTPPSVRVITAFVRFVATHRGLSLAIAAGAFVAVSLVASIYAVANGETAAVRRFGRMVTDAVGPGLALRAPWGIDRIDKVKTGQVARLAVTGDFEEQIGLVTGDENLIDIGVVVQYQITQLGASLFGVEDAGALLAHAVRTALVGAAASMPVDDVLTSGKAKIETDVRREAQAMMERYGTGLTLVAVNLQSVNPPSEAAASFRKVNDAKAEAARMQNDAESERDQRRNLARGEAGKRLHEAGQAADSRKRQAAGAADRFRQVLVQKTKTPELTRVDLYTDMAMRALAKARLVILAPGEAPRVDINLIEREASPTPTAKTPGAAVAKASEPLPDEPGTDTAPVAPETQP